jgi:hypothetical protein
MARGGDNQVQVLTQPPIWQHGAQKPRGPFSAETGKRGGTAEPDRRGSSLAPLVEEATAGGAIPQPPPPLRNDRWGLQNQAAVEHTIKVRASDHRGKADRGLG